MFHKNSDGPTGSHLATAPLTEEAVLDAALERPDELLVASLQVEERRRRKLRRIAGCACGLVMAAAAAVLLIPADSGLAAEASTLAQQGWELWKQREYSAAEEKFQQAVMIDPQLDSAWSGLGWARLNGGKTDASIEAFAKCVELVPKHPAAQNGLGQAYLSLRKYDLAEQHLTIAADQASAAWFGLARLYLLTGNFAESEKWCEKIVATQPQDPVVTQMLAAAKARHLGDELRETIEPPDASEVEAARGWQLMNTGQMARAREVFEKLLAADADNLVALNGYGFCLLNTGEPAKARVQFEKYLALQPDSPGPLNGLARCLKAEGQLDEAIKIWTKLVEGSSEVNAGHLGLAETYLEQKDYEKAVAYYSQVVAAMPENEYFAERLQAARAGLKKSQESKKP